jgi:hypothetical protein
MYLSASYVNMLRQELCRIFYPARGPLQPATAPIQGDIERYTSQHKAPFKLVRTANICYYEGGGKAVPILNDNRENPH